MGSDPLENRTDAVETYNPFGTQDMYRPKRATRGPAPAVEEKPVTPGKMRSTGSGSVTPPYGGGGRQSISADSEGNWFGKYRPLRKLGDGGMGDVWLVEHIGLDMKRALKIIKDPSNRLRFQQEAKILAQLSKHPNAVEVHDTGLVGDHAYIEMDYLEGLTLDKWLKSRFRDRTPLDDVLWFLSELCDVLGEAHKLGIIHRDIKPSNIMIVADPSSKRRERVKVLDFGIAKIIRQSGEDSDTESLTMHTKGYLGTVHYSSPEQLMIDMDGQENVRVDQQSDIYSIGVLLYEILAGNRPFTGDKYKIAYDHVHTTPPPFPKRSSNSRVPAVIEKVVIRCLEKSPDKRPQSAQELFEIFRDAVAKSQPRQPNPQPPTDGSQSVVTKVAGTSDWAPHVPSFLTQVGLPRILPRKSILRLFLVLTLISGVVSGAVVGLLSAGRATTTNPSSKGTGPLVTIPSTPISPPTSIVPEWVKDHLKSHDFKPADGAALDKSGWPERIRRISINGSKPMVLRGELYLPEGVEYTPKTDEGTSPAGLPKVLVRLGDEVRFHLVEGGEFLMGYGGEPPDNCSDDQKLGHPATLSSYYMQETEVTNKEIRDFWGDRSQVEPEIEKFWAARGELRQTVDSATWEKHPAVGISRKLAEEYAHRVGGELPTERQWEFAARSRVPKRRYVWPDDDVSDKKGNLKAHVNSKEYGSRVYDTRQVDLDSLSSDSTEQGVRGLAGNAREWCRDVWRCYPKGAPPNHWERADEGDPNAVFVIRGGSFKTPPETLQVTWRKDILGPDGSPYKAEADKTFEDVGFRVVLEVVAKRSSPARIASASRLPREGSP